MDNADLDKLRISPGRLVPKFLSRVTEYSVTVASEITEVKLTPITSDSGASCIVKGDATSKTIQLQEGKTAVIELVITAEDGHSIKTYNVSIHRLSSNDACLSQLDISAGKLQPNFNPNILTYYCDLPSNLTSLTIRTKTEDPKIKVNFKDGSPVGTVTLSAGLTDIDVVVISPNGSSQATYKINALRLQCPYIMQLKSGYSPKYMCTACSGVLYCPCKVNDGSGEGIYCRQCLLELSRINKVDPLTTKPLGEGWMIMDQSRDKEVSSQPAFCFIPFGKVEGMVGEIPALIARQRNSEEVSDSCADCSKKVPSGLLEIHKKFSCSSKLNETLPKTEVKQLSWEKILIDDSLSSNLDEVLKTAFQWEEKYLNLLKEQDPTTCGTADILELLNKAASSYATAIRIAPKDARGHIGLGIVMEEMFYVGDLFGHKPIQSDDDDNESDAEKSSKEEEFLAICKLHGVSGTASLVLQLKAVEAEYQSLKQANQSHRAEHVQQLYQWKSKKALQDSKGSYTVDSESPLYKAKLKFEHAVSVKPSDHMPCYQLGRISLLLGDVSTAEKCLKVAASIKPTHIETLVCLGKALSQSNPIQSKSLLVLGLGTYLQIREEVSEGSRCMHVTQLHGNEFWRPSNIIIGECFLTLASLGGHGFLNEYSCLLAATRLLSNTPGLQKGSTMQQLLWILLRARTALLEKALKDKSNHASILCQQVSAMITHCQLPATEELRNMQMKVFENGVVLDSTSSTALTHLGTGQLQQFEATGDKTWLTIAEKSFRASIACEGRPQGGIEPPEEITQQDWWKKRIEVEKGDSKLSTQTPSKTTTQQPAGTKQTTPIGKGGVKPPSQAPGRGKPQAAPVRQPVGRGRQQPVSKPVAGPSGRGGRGTTQPTGRIQAGRGKAVATLGDLKTGSKPTDSISKPTTINKPTAKTEDVKPEANDTTDPVKTAPGKLNEVTYHPRLGLARALAKQEGKISEESITFYHEVIKMAPNIHDAYIELGELLAKSDPIGAVVVYSKFPFSDPPSFDDAYLHGEIIRLLMSSTSYDDPRLVTSMIAMGKALGIAVLDRHVSTLEAKFKTGLLKQIYAGIHGKPVDDPGLQAFFKFKCWT